MSVQSLRGRISPDQVTIMIFRTGHSMHMVGPQGRQGWLDQMALVLTVLTPGGVLHVLVTFEFGMVLLRRHLIKSI